ncbi:hypothetical protein [Mycoplasmopsis pullorum]|uniref:Uncharacterized protein n=1 Tax=Mycoplasmopsis pullorum TaxID=48003 RepID=A0A1L4FST9_9BACT|nr:hypothetical protein [Mycoplasmopsis pullorum]APJ38685.1 hypothetical protein BLA55_03425 [Mycoplasmopsis pullorum]
MDTLIHKLANTSEMDYEGSNIKRGLTTFKEYFNGLFKDVSSTVQTFGSLTLTIIATIFAGYFIFKLIKTFKNRNLASDSSKNIQKSFLINGIGLILCLIAVPAFIYWFTLIGS